MQSCDVITKIFQSQEKTVINFPGNELADALRYGFSFVEYKDHLVSYVVINASMAKRIFSEMDDSQVGGPGGAIGNLWTATLYLSDRVKNQQILFSNENFSEILKLNVNVDKESANANL